LIIDRPCEETPDPGLIISLKTSAVWVTVAGASRWTPLAYSRGVSVP